MIKIYLLDFSGAEAQTESFSALPDFVKNTKNPCLRRQRIFSYMLLFYAYKEYTKKKNVPAPSLYDNDCLQKEKINSPSSDKNSINRIPKVERDRNGRPYFLDLDIDFNLSHDGEMAALVISDEGRVGIDIQRHIEDVSQKLKDKASEIYENKGIYALLDKDAGLNAEIECLKYSEGEGLSKENADIVELGQSCDFFSLWTCIEAISKADGGGLSLLSGIDFKDGAFSFLRAGVKDKSKNSYTLFVCAKRSKKQSN